MSKPTIGKTVHYMAHGSKDGTHPQVCRPAIVVEATDRDERGAESDFPICNLFVMNPLGAFHNWSHFEIPEALEGGTWHYACAAAREQA